MIDRSGTAKIIDFGATHVAGLTEGLTDSPALPAPGEGTLQYTAPEYFTGQGSSARSDLSRWRCWCTRCPPASCLMACKSPACAARQTPANCVRARAPPAP